ncbi:transmembrane protein [Cystoisospora suis]|uniref:Transmembrane protein n=1 Tax=Cystoisospora suis TaxID=483139 RepID=A0A2C6KVP6_9APIC|nr:transmembrane protein [Cystoisospora suis]
MAASRTLSTFLMALAVASASVPALTAADSDFTSKTVQAAALRVLGANDGADHAKPEDDRSDSSRGLASVLRLPMFYLDELFTYLEQLMTSDALQVPLNLPPPAHASTPSPASLSSMTPEERRRARGGNSEIRVFFNVSPLKMLNKVCHGARDICVAEFIDSLYTVISAVTQDPSFTRDRVKMTGVSARHQGVEQIITIADDSDLRFAQIAKEALLDIPKCGADTTLPICQTLTGKHLSLHGIAPQVTSIRPVRPAAP